MADQESNQNTTRLEPGSPARFGAWAGMLVGVAAFIWGVSRFFVAEPPSAVYSLAFVVAGLLNTLCCMLSLVRSRMAWAFAVSLNGTAAVLFLFGIPQVRDGLGTKTVFAAAPCLVFAIITALLVTGSDQYEQR
jgi:hypothetical protein